MYMANKEQHIVQIESYQQKKWGQTADKFARNEEIDQKNLI